MACREGAGEGPEASESGEETCESEEKACESGEEACENEEEAEKRGRVFKERKREEAREYNMQTGVAPNHKQQLRTKNKKTTKITHQGSKK